MSHIGGGCVDAALGQDLQLVMMLTFVVCQRAAETCRGTETERIPMDPKSQLNPLSHVLQSWQTGLSLTEQQQANTFLFKVTGAFAAALRLRPAAELGSESLNYLFSSMLNPHYNTPTSSLLRLKKLQLLSVPPVTVNTFLNTPDTSFITSALNTDQGSAFTLHLQLPQTQPRP